MDIGIVRKQPKAWHRFWAAIIDFSIMSLLITVVTLFIVSLATGWQKSQTQAETWQVALVLLLMIVAMLMIVIVYPAVLMARPGNRNGQTVGKQLFGFRVVHQDSQPMTFRRGLRREGLGKLPLMLLCWPLATLPFVMLIDFQWKRIKKASGRTLHDQLGRTYVLQD